MKVKKLFGVFRKVGWMPVAGVILTGVGTAMLYLQFFAPRVFDEALIRLGLVSEDVVQKPEEKRRETAVPSRELLLPPEITIAYPDGDFGFHIGEPMTVVYTLTERAGQRLSLNFAALPRQGDPLGHARCTLFHSEGPNPDVTNTKPKDGRNTWCLAFTVQCFLPAPYRYTLPVSDEKFLIGYADAVTGASGAFALPPAYFHVERRAPFAPRFARAIPLSDAEASPAMDFVYVPFWAAVGLLLLILLILRTKIEERRRLRAQMRTAHPIIADVERTLAFLAGRDTDPAVLVSALSEAHLIPHGDEVLAQRILNGEAESLEPEEYVGFFERVKAVAKGSSGMNGNLAVSANAVDRGDAP